MQKEHKQMRIFKFKKYSYYRNRREYLKYRLKWFHIIKSCIPIKCKVCGYDKVWHALHFHHKDSENKKFTISSMMRKKPNKNNIRLMKKELKKCICLCARCHMEIHKSDYDLIVDYDKVVNIVNSNVNRKVEIKNESS